MYDLDNVFAKILRGELPCNKVYEDEETFAFLDIMPRAEGHTLVIPRSPARNLLDASEEQLAAIIRTTQRISRAVLKAFDAQGVTIQQFNEPAGGQVVFHFHVHILPRWNGVALSKAGQMGDQVKIRANAQKIREALGVS